MEADIDDVNAKIEQTRSEYYKAEVQIDSAKARQDSVTSGFSAESRRLSTLKTKQNMKM